MTILVTGGAGFIGSHVVEHHLKQGQEVYAIDNLIGGSRDNIKAFLDNPLFHFIESDLESLTELPALLTKVDRVYHLAAILGMFRVLEHPLQTLEGNIKSTEVILKAMHLTQKPPVLMIASSSEVYGSQAIPLTENTPLILETTSKNHSNYPISKICNESMALSYYHQYQLPLVVVRIFNTIGQRQTGRYGMVVPRFITQALKNEPITIFGDGSQSRSFCDVRDTVNLFDKLLSNPQAIGEIVNVGHNETVTIADLAKTICHLAHSQSELQYFPFEEVYHNGYIDIHQRIIDIQKLQALTHYKYRYRLEKTLQDLIATIRAQL